MSYRNQKDADQAHIQSLEEKYKEIEREQQIRREKISELKKLPAKTKKRDFSIITVVITKVTLFIFLSFIAVSFIDDCQEINRQENIQIQEHNETMTHLCIQASQFRNCKIPYEIDWKRRSTSIYLNCICAKEDLSPLYYKILIPHKLRK
jgi:hypothetical protein